MCGRYTLNDPKELKTRYQTVNNVEGFDFNTTFYPSATAPVIIQDQNQTIIKPMTWGFFDKIFNARAETVAEKPIFKDSYQHRRCLVPTTGFYEYKDKHPYLFTNPSLPIFSLAGIYQNDTFTILTEPANDIVASIHPRMPVILDSNTEIKWLNQIDFSLPALIPISSSLNCN